MTGIPELSRRDFNAPCEDRPGVVVGEDLADKLVTEALNVYALKTWLGNLCDAVDSGDGERAARLVVGSRQCLEALNADD